MAASVPAAQQYRNRRGGKDEPKACGVCHRLAKYPYHHEFEEGKKPKKISTGRGNCIWQPCPGEAGADHKCSKKGCPCYVADPNEVVEHHKQKAQAAKIAAEQLRSQTPWIGRDAV